MWTNLAAEAAGLAFTVLVVDAIAAKQNEDREKRDLILQMASPDNAFAREARAFQAPKPVPTAKREVVGPQRQDQKSYDSMNLSRHGRILTNNLRVRHRPDLGASVVEKLMSGLPRNVGAMILKDIRTFLRDPMQWSQALIFFGLLAIYFVNLRTFRYHLLPDRWRNTIAFLNVFSVSAVMCSLGSRFVYPQLSLEGQGFWILGLSPMTMKRIVLTKFFLSFVGMLVVSTALMLVSTTMLEAARTAKLAALGLACAVSCAVCGLSTGLGAIFLDLDQRNPAAIVSGFGGTLNLVLSLGFMVLAILPFGLTFHLHIRGVITPPQFGRGLSLCGGWLAAITAATAVLPITLGVKSLQDRDF